MTINPTTTLSNRLNIHHWLLLAITLILLNFTSQVYAKNISVKTDRQIVEMGDIITLLIETDFQTRGKSLNLKSLEDQFDVLNTQQSNQIQIINGQYTSFTRWRIQLLPKQEGKLIIPSLSIGDVTSQAYEIEVLKPRYTPGNEPYFLEARIDKNEVFVQEQVIYTLRFYHKGSLINGNIRPPTFDNALVEPLKEQSVFGKTINGQQYTVYEWQYALFPQSSGELAIPGPSFTGLLHLRGKQKGVKSVAEPSIINVLPAVPNDQAWWLPANEIKIEQAWDNLPNTLYVGDSLRRVITLQASGLKSSQLPTLNTANTDGYKVYADEAKEQQSLSEKGVNSVKTVAQAIVPIKAGTLVLPEQKITWWNTNTQHVETTILQSQTLTILPAKNSPTEPTSTLTDNSISTYSNSINQPIQNTALNTTQNAPSADESFLALARSFWPVLSVVLFTLWLITLIMLLRLKKQFNGLSESSKETTANQKTIAGVVNSRWCDLPLEAFYQELLRQLHEELAIKNVDAIVNEKLKQAIWQLEAHLYKGQSLADDTRQIICDNWPELFANSKPSSKSSKKVELVNLYGE